MPAVGISVDRRAFKLLADVFSDETVYSLIGFVCAQVRTHTRLRDRRGVEDLPKVKMLQGSWLRERLRRDPAAFDFVLGCSNALKGYARVVSEEKTHMPWL